MTDILDRNLALGVLMAMFILAIAPALFPPRRGELPETVGQLLAQYIYGTSSLLLGYGTWLALVDRLLLPTEAAVGIAIITAAGGVTVLARYGSRWVKAMWARYQINKHKAARLEDERTHD